VSALKQFDIHANPFPRSRDRQPYLASLQSDLLARSLVRAEQEKRWLEENAAAISSINEFIDQHGLLASRLRYRPDGQ